MVLCSIEALKREKQQENFRKVLWGIFTNTWCAVLVHAQSQSQPKHKPHSTQPLTFNPLSTHKHNPTSNSSSTSPNGTCNFTKKLGKKKGKSFKNQDFTHIMHTHSYPYLNNHS